MDLLDYDIKVLEKLSEGRKNIYQLWKAIEEDGKKTDYRTIRRATVRLEEKELIELIGIKGPRNSKEYEILLRGMAGLYSAKREKKSPLEFHRSEDTQKIIDKIIRIFFKGGKDRDREKENLFLRTLRISPSLVEVLPTLGDLIKPHIIKDPHLFMEVFRHSVGLFPVDIFLENRDEKKVHMSFLREEFPLKILADDFERHPDDGEIKRLFSYALMKKYRSMGKESIKEKRKVFNTVLKAVRENIVDPKGSPDEQWRKFDEFVTSEEGKLWETKECWTHLYLYLPPGSDPRLLCDGKCSIPSVL